MVWITKADLSIIDRISDHIIDYCLNNSPWSQSVDFSPPKFDAPVKIAPKVGQLEELEQYEANSSILLTIPFGGWAELRRKGRKPPPAVKNAIYSMLGHELAHVRQHAANPVSFASVNTKQKQFNRASATTARDWFDGYYWSNEEVEAHASQAAAEIFLKASSAAAIVDPLSADILTTEALKRPCERLGAPRTTGDADIEHWWSCVYAGTLKELIGLG